jgi:hypothetical protein
MLVSAEDDDRDEERPILCWVITQLGPPGEDDVEDESALIDVEWDPARGFVTK